MVPDASYLVSDSLYIVLDNPYMIPNPYMVFEMGLLFHVCEWSFLTRFFTSTTEIGCRLRVVVVIDEWQQTIY